MRGLRGLTMSAEWEQQHYPLPTLEEEDQMFGIYARNVLAGQGRYVPDRPTLPPATPSVNLNSCEWDKERRILKLASEYCGMPDMLSVISHRTGKTVRFAAVRQGDPLWDEDGWDGEQRIYRPLDSTNDVKYLVIYHQW